jgi:hypothetical protein
MTALTSHAQKALSVLRRHGRMVLRRHNGIPIWQAAKRAGGLKMIWNPVIHEGMFMSSAIDELSRNGLIEWEAVDRVKLREPGNG